MEVSISDLISEVLILMMFFLNFSAEVDQKEEKENFILLQEEEICGGDIRERQVAGAKENDQQGTDSHRPDEQCDDQG